MENFKTVILPSCLNDLSMNNKRFFLLCILAIGIHIAFAQDGNKLHVLKKGETLSMLASKYNTTVGDIMRLNGMHQDTKLVIGSKIKIPQGSVAANTSTAAHVKSIPVKPETTKVVKEQTHVVKQGETLFAISKMYSVSVDQIKAWNNLTSDDVNAGQQLIINSNTVITTNANDEVATQQPVKEPENKPAVSEQQTAPTTQHVDTANNITQQPQTVDTNTSLNNPTNNAPVTTPPVQPAATNTSNTTINPSSVGPEGYFASLFGVDVQQRSLKTVDGVSMTFKTASGWADKKYYILMNDVPPGSIVKVIANSKTIYAKVLWSLGEMKENEGLQFRISNAASAALGIADQKFNISVTYYE